MAYYPAIRQMCIEVTGRDNRAAHLRFDSKLTEDEYGVFERLYTKMDDEYYPLSYGEVYEILSFRWALGLRLTSSDRAELILIEKIVGTSW